MGAGTGTFVGAKDGTDVDGTKVGTCVGFGVGLRVGSGFGVGAGVGYFVGFAVLGAGVGFREGRGVAMADATAALPDRERIGNCAGTGGGSLVGESTLACSYACDDWCASDGIVDVELVT